MSLTPCAPSAVGQHVASGAGAAPGAGGGDGAATLSACRALFDTVFEGLRTMGEGRWKSVGPSLPFRHSLCEYVSHLHSARTRLACFKYRSLPGSRHHNSSPPSLTQMVKSRRMYSPAMDPHLRAWVPL